MAEATHDEMVERARKLAPGIAGRWEEADRLRDIPPTTIAEIKDAGLTRLYQPKRWGGYEADPRTFYAAQNVFAEVCPSTAWVYGVHSIQAFLIGGMNEQAQIDVWGEDSNTLAGSSFAPTGTAERVEGGFRLSGRWTFSSGSTYTKWALVGGKIANEPPPTSGPMPLNLFLIPSSDYEIVDVWDTYGLRGTGSNDLVAKDIFVPDHRQVPMAGGIQNLTSASSSQPRLYRMPWLYMFSSTINNLAVGMCRGVLNAFLDIARNRISPFTGKATKDDPMTALAISRLAAEINTAEAMYERHIAAQLDHIDRDVAMPIKEALVLRVQMTSQLRKMTTLVDDLMLMQGSRMLFRDSLMTRFWLDLTAARGHIGNDPVMPSTILGQMLMSEA